MLRRKTLAFATKVALTSALLFLVFRAVDISGLRLHLGRLNAGLLAALVFLCWIGQMLCAQRWRLFARSLGIGGTYGRFLQLYFAGMFLNIGLPSLIGGDAVKAFVSSRRAGKPLTLGFAAVLQDRAAGLISLLAYGTAAALLSNLSYHRIPLGLVYGFLWLGLAVLFAAMWKSRRLYTAFASERQQTPLGKALRLLEDFHGSLIAMRMSAASIFQISAFSLLNSGLVLWMYCQVSVAAGEPVGLIAFSALFPLIVLLTMLPISLGGIGIREWAYLEGLALAGITPDRALFIALTTSALIVVSNLAGIVFLPSIPVELRRSQPPKVDEPG